MLNGFFAKLRAENPPLMPPAVFGVQGLIRPPQKCHPLGLIKSIAFVACTTCIVPSSFAWPQCLLNRYCSSMSTNWAHERRAYWGHLSTADWPPQTHVHGCPDYAHVSPRLYTQPPGHARPRSVTHVYTRFIFVVERVFARNVRGLVPRLLGYP